MSNVKGGDVRTEMGKLKSERYSIFCIEEAIFLGIKWPVMQPIPPKGSKQSPFVTLFYTTPIIQLGSRGDAWVTGTIKPEKLGGEKRSRSGRLGSWCAGCFKTTY